MKTCKGSIVRKSLIYTTKVEYGDYTINHIEGCAHGCLYPCYAMLLKKRFGRVYDYNDWINPRIVSNTIELLNKELKKNSEKIKCIHLCFTTDPFMYGYSDIEDLSIKVIKLINSFGISCSVLTKGVLPKVLSSYSKSNTYGITLISLDENFRKKMEPFAAPYQERIKALKYLSEKGCKTWISIEPYPTPNIIESNIEELLNEIKFSNKIIFGRMNYNKTVSGYKEAKRFYNQISEKVINFCDINNIAYHIKNGTITH